MEPQAKSVVLISSRSKFNSGAPATPRGRVLSGCAKRTGGRPKVLAKSSVTSCGPADAGPPGQHTHAWRCRATGKSPAHVLFCLFLAAAPFAQAQTVDPGQTSLPTDQLEDIRPPYFYLHSWFWWWIALAVVGAVALLILLWFWLRPRHLLSPKNAYELALEKLEKARALLREDNPMPYAVLVSETIRSYLGQRFESPSTRRTTEEFLRQMEADRTTPLAEHRNLLRDFLQSCDLVKFARYQPTLVELEQVHQRATDFVTATKPLPPPSPQNGK